MMLAISLQRTYGSVPHKELKKRAAAKDAAAQALLKATGYGASLRALLWAIIVVLAALFCIVTARATETWFAVLISSTLLWFGFIWLPAQRATQAGVWLATRLAPAFAKVLHYIHPTLDKCHKFIRSRRPLSVHTGLYDVEDLLTLFKRQKVQSDNRIGQQTLDIAEHSLKFGDKLVSNVLTPRRVVKLVAVNDTIGPVLMDDLHSSGFSRFPVYDGPKDNIVGVLYLRDVVKAKSGGTVQKVMNKQVCYVHEDEPLMNALSAILKTHQQLFIVVNSFEEYVGVVSMEDVLEEIIGKQIVDEFDQYEDLRAVAAKTAAKEHRSHAGKYSDSQSATEVVE